jgi:Transglutaminase-like superfamily
MRIRWTRLPFGDGRWLVYSPRFGRTYLLDADSAIVGVLPALFGLHSAEYRDSLEDPAGSVVPVDAAHSDAAVGRLLPLLYALFHRHRAVASIARGMRLAKWLTRLQPSRRQWGAPEVGRLVLAVERSVGISDCYPRALLTAYLCMLARLRCELTVGILAPTRNMHAWCSIEGSIPYEPEPEHWYYSPLVVFDVTY